MTKVKPDQSFVAKVANILSDKTQGEFFRQRLNAVIDGHAGIHAVGIYSFSGDPLLRDVNIGYKSEAEQDRYYQFFGEYLQDWFGYLVERSGREFDNAIYDEIGRLDYLRLSLDGGSAGEKYFAISWIDKSRSVFLVATCWEKSKYTNTTFEAAYRKLLKDVRERIQAIS